MKTKEEKFLESKGISKPTYEGVRLVDGEMKAYKIIDLLQEYADQQTNPPNAEDIKKWHTLLVDKGEDEMNESIELWYGWKELENSGLDKPYQPPQPTNEEINKEAKYKFEYYSEGSNEDVIVGYKIGMKQMRDNYQPKQIDWNKILKGLQSYCLIDGNDKPIIGGKCIDYLKTEVP